MFRLDTIQLKRLAWLAGYPFIFVLNWVGFLVVLLLIPVSMLVLEVVSLARRALGARSHRSH